MSKRHELSVRVKMERATTTYRMRAETWGEVLDALGRITPAGFLLPSEKDAAETKKRAYHPPDGYPNRKDKFVLTMTYAGRELKKGYSYRQIADKLNGMGYRTRGGRGWTKGRLSSALSKYRRGFYDGDGRRVK